MDGRAAVVRNRDSRTVSTRRMRGAMHHVATVVRSDSEAGGPCGPASARAGGRCEGYAAHGRWIFTCEVDENGLPGAVASDFQKIPAKAAERWGHGSPGIVGATKDYRIVAKELAKRDGLVIRTKAYSGKASSGAIMKIVSRRGTASR